MFCSFSSRTFLLLQRLSSFKSTQIGKLIFRFLAKISKAGGDKILLLLLKLAHRGGALRTVFGFRVHFLLLILILFFYFLICNG